MTGSRKHSKNKLMTSSSFHESLKRKVDFRFLAQHFQLECWLKVKQHELPSDLQVVEALEVDVQVGLDAVDGARQGDASDEQDKQNHVGHGGGDVDHLKDSSTKPEDKLHVARTYAMCDVMMLEQIFMAD